MITKLEIDRFYETVDKMAFKFPVAAIAQATGFSKGNVSDVLRKAKSPSQGFLSAFYRAFPESTQNVPREIRGGLSGDVKDILSSLADSYKLLAESHRDVAASNLLLAKKISSAETVLASDSSVEKELNKRLGIEVAASGKKGSDSALKSGQQKGSVSGGGK